MEKFRETESLKIWENPDWINEEEIKGGFEIDLGDNCKLKAVGFNEIRDKKTEELIFAYKFKHEDKTILFYNPSKDIKVLRILKEISFLGGYNLQNFEDSLKVIKSEMEIIKHKGEKNERKRGNNKSSKN